MIGRIKRIVKGPGAKGWHEEWRLEPESDDDSEPEEETQNVEPTTPTSESRQEPDGRGHFVNLVEASLAQGGKHGNYRISVYWLKVILAGLQGRDVERQVIFGEGGEDGAGWDEPSSEDETLYQDLARV